MLLKHIIALMRPDSGQIFIDGVTITEKKVELENELKFSAQIAKRFYDLTFRGGIIESTGGFALGWMTLSVISAMNPFLPAPGSVFRMKI